MTAEDSSFHKILPDLKKGRSAVIEMFGYLRRFDRMMFSCSYRCRAALIDRYFYDLIGICIPKYPALQVLEAVMAMRCLPFDIL